MNRILDMLGKYCTERDIQYHAAGNEIRFVAEAGWTILAIALSHEDEGLLSLQASLSIRVPSKRRQEMIQLINYVNWKMPSGMFVVDMSDGTIVYRISAPIEEENFMASECTRIVNWFMSRLIFFVTETTELLTKVASASLSAKAAQTILRAKIGNQGVRRELPEQLLELEAIEMN